MHQVYALPPNRACMSSSSHRPDLHFLTTWGRGAVCHIEHLQDGNQNLSLHFKHNNEGH